MIDFTWQWILSQSIMLLIALPALIIGFQLKKKTRTMICFAIAAGSASIAFVFLGNYVMAAFLCLSVLRNVCFLWIEYRGAKVSKATCIFLLCLFICIATVSIIFTYEWWVDGALYVIAVSKVFAYWVKGTRGSHLIRLAQLPGTAFGIAKHLTFVDIMGIVIEVIMLVSIGVFYIRLYQSKRKSRLEIQCTNSLVLERVN